MIGLFRRLGRFLSSWTGTLGVLLLASWIAYASLLAPALQALEKAERWESDLRREFDRKQHKAVNLEPYKEQMGQLEQIFGEFLTQLPDRFRTSELQADIGRLVTANAIELVGLEFAGEVNREFYATREAVLTLRAPFPNLTAFFTQLSRLQRVVAPTGLKLERRGAGADIEAVFEFKVFRYLTEGEVEEDDRQRRKTNQRRRS